MPQQITFSEPLLDILSHYGYDTVPSQVSLTVYTKMLECIFDYYYSDDLLIDDDTGNISLRAGAESKQ